MKQILGSFFRSESGAVTVDWVVLCAAIIGLGMIVLMPIAYITDSSAEKIGDRIGEMELGYRGK